MRKKKENRNVTYYQDSNGLLYFKIRNNIYRIKGGRKVDVSEAEFTKVFARVIKKQKYEQLLNDQCNNHTVIWEHEKVKYKAMKPLIDEDGNYTIKYVTLPRHGKFLNGYEAIKVVHQCKVFYFFLYGGFDYGCLYDINTKRFVKWTHGKNVRPIINFWTKEYV